MYRVPHIPHMFKDGNWKATRNAFCSRCYARAKRICDELGVDETVKKAAQSAAHKLAYDNFNASVGGPATRKSAK